MAGQPCQCGVSGVCRHRYAVICSVQRANLEVQQLMFLFSRCKQPQGQATRGASNPRGICRMVPSTPPLIGLPWLACVALSDLTASSRTPLSLALVVEVVKLVCTGGVSPASLASLWRVALEVNDVVVSLAFIAAVAIICKPCWRPFKLA